MCLRTSRVSSDFLPQASTDNTTRPARKGRRGLPLWRARHLFEERKPICHDFQLTRFPMPHRSQLSGSRRACGIAQREHFELVKLRSAEVFFFVCVLWHKGFSSSSKRSLPSECCPRLFGRCRWHRCRQRRKAIWSRSGCAQGLACARRRTWNTARSCTNAHTHVKGVSCSRSVVCPLWVGMIPVLSSSDGVGSRRFWCGLLLHSRLLAAWLSAQALCLIRRVWTRSTA